MTVSPHNTRIQQIWELVAEFRFGLERLKIEQRRLPQVWGMSEAHAKVDQAILRAQQDIDNLIWAIQTLTGEEIAPTLPADIEARVRTRLLLLD